MAPLAGLLIIQPLSGDGEGESIAEKPSNQGLLPALGRSDLLEPGTVEAIEMVPASDPPEGKPARPEGDKPGEELVAADADEGAPEELPDEGAGEGGTGALPGISAGEGPGSVEGTVFGPDGRGVPGVIITLPDQGGFQTQTDAEGSFRITGLPTAGVTAQYLKPGYLEKVDVMQVREEGVTRLRVGLELKPVELADGEYLLDTEEVILDPVEDETSAPGITVDAGPGLTGGGLSKDFLSKAGAGDAAGAVEKISGANVVGGKFVVVRGLGDRYNNTTLNGGIVPSPETSRKAVQLDLFPSNALEGVAIQKTLSPELPADYVGGLVQLQTLTQSDKDFFSVQVGTNFDSITQSHGQFFTVPGMGLTSDLKPSGIVPIPTLTTRASGASAQAERQAFFDSVKFRPQQSSPDFDRSLTASFAKTWDLDGNSKLKLLGTIGRSWEQRFREFEQSRFRNRIQLTDGAPLSSLDTRYADLGSVQNIGSTTFFDGLVGNFVQNNYTQSNDFNALLSGSLAIGNNLELTGSFFNYRSGESEYTLIDNGVTRLSDFDLGEQEDSLARNAVILNTNLGPFAANSYRQVYNKIYRDLEFGQVGGVYRLDDWREGASLSWNAYRGATSEVSPRSYELQGYFISQLGNNVDPLSGITIPNPDNLGNPNSSSVFEFATMDETTQYKVDASLPLLKHGENRKITLTSGFSTFRRQRDSRVRSGIIANGSQIRDVEEAFAATERLLNDLEIGTALSIDASNTFVPGSAGVGATPEYRGTNEVNAFYFGLDSDWDAWTLRGGIRYKEERRGFFIPSGRRPLTQDRLSDDFFPSISLIRHFGAARETKLNLSYSESVVRPTFYEFIPAFILDLTNQRIIVGNQQLRESRAQNFDLTLSWKRDKNYAGINGFYKIINDPIFTINDPSGATGLGGRTFANLGETEVYGVELEASRDLAAGFSVTGNLSLIESSAQPGTIEANRQFFEAQIDRLEGQPNLLGNLILSWEQEDGWSSNLVYNYTGEYLTVASLGFVGDPDSALPNEVRNPFHSLDWNLSKTWETDLAEYKLKLQIRNILDSDVEVRYEGLADSLAPAEAISPGRQFGMSFQAKF